MWTEPTEFGTSTWRQVVPASWLMARAAVSWLPVHRKPGCGTQRKSGSSQAPSWRTWTGPRTKVPGGSGRSLGGWPASRMRTTQASWSPPGCAVWRTRRRPSGASNWTGFCSDRSGSSVSRSAGPQPSAPRVERWIEMSDLPSSEPPNQRQCRPSAPWERNAAWFCTQGDGSSASQRPSPAGRSCPSIAAAIWSGLTTSESLAMRRPPSCRVRHCL